MLWGTGHNWNRSAPSRGTNPAVLRVLICAALVLIHSASALQAGDFIESMEGPEVSWEIQFDPQLTQKVEHRRHSTIRRQGQRSEQLILDAQAPSPVALSHHVSPARVLDELKATVWVRSNRGGATFALRVVYPRLKDPETGEIVTRIIEGDAYQGDGTWQNLTCGTVDVTLARLARLLRAKFGAAADLRDVHVDQALLLIQAAPGTTELFIDDLRLGPVVSPARELLVPSTTPQAEELEAPVELRLDRLWVEGQPFVPRIMAHRGESTSELAELRINPLWIPDYSDESLLRELRSLGIWAMAAPPIATSPTGEILDADTASLSPLGADSHGILFWMMGNGIAPGERKRLSSWREQLLLADRKLHRPLLADVTGHERAFSRLVPMLGSTHTVHQTHFDYLRYRDWLSDRQQISRPGGFQWTWLHTAPDAAWVESRNQRRLDLPVIEPEQLRLQLYSALTAGCRGVGYWSTERMSFDHPQQREMLWQIKQLNFELQLLEPWLATGNVVGQARILDSSRSPAERDSSAESARLLGNRGIRQADRKVLGNARRVTPASAVVEGEQSPLTATLLETDYGLLVLGVWHDPLAQFVPGPQAAHGVQILVPGVKETARAWQVTTTDIIPLHSDRNAVPGGTLITIPRWEVTLAVVVASDTTLRDALARKMSQMRQESAQCWVELAQQKWDRVRITNQELVRLGHPQPDGERLINKSRQLWQQARQHLEQQDFVKARADAEGALQSLRILQRAHWETAVAELTQPLASEHTLCFATLPDFWRDRKRHPPGAWSGANLLVSGSFDDEATFQTAAWKHIQSGQPDVRAVAELIPQASDKGYQLRIAAGPAEQMPPPLLVSEPPVLVTTPSMPVRAGQLVRIAGRIRIVHAIQRTREGFEIRDSLSHTGQTCSWKQTDGWESFDFVREATRTGDLTLEFVLHGLGEVWLDNLTVTPFE